MSTSQPVPRPGLRPLDEALADLLAAGLVDLDEKLAPLESPAP